MIYQLKEQILYLPENSLFPFVFSIEKSQSQNPNVQIRHDHVCMRKNGVLLFQ
jgi:hypothetical protein